LKDPKLRF